MVVFARAKKKKGVLNRKLYLSPQISISSVVRFGENRSAKSQHEINIVKASGILYSL